MTGADTIVIGGTPGSPWTYGNTIMIEGSGAGLQPKIIAGLTGVPGGEDNTMDRLALITAKIKPTSTYPWGSEQIIKYEGIFINPPRTDGPPPTPFYYKLSTSGGTAGSISRAGSAASIQADGWIGIPLTNGVPTAWYHVTNAILYKNCSAGLGACPFFSMPSMLTQKCSNPDPSPCPDIPAVQRTLKVEIRVKFANANQSITVTNLPLASDTSPGPGDIDVDQFSAPPGEFIDVIKKKCKANIAGC
jgi:hypothetical protein